MKEMYNKKNSKIMATPYISILVGSLYYEDSSIF
jgi:hypothetical protein